MNGNAAIAAGPEEGQIPLRSPQDTPLSETPSTEKDAEELPAKIAAATVNTPASNKDKPKATPKSSGKRVKKEAEEGGQDVTPSKKPKNEVPESHATPTTKARQRKVSTFSLMRTFANVPWRLPQTRSPAPRSRLPWRR